MVLDVLRERTAALHRRVEAAVNLPNRCGSVEAYRALLARMWGLYLPIERQLEAFDWGLLGLDFDQRRKAGLLSADLVALGMTRAAVEGLPQCPGPPLPASLAEATGCLYVLEGATLGGQVIARKVNQTLGITRESGGSFHAPYGEQAGAMWRTFREAANRYCGEDERRIEAAAAGAVNTFEAFGRWVGNGQGQE